MILMDKDLKDVLTYVLGGIVGYATIAGSMTLFVKDMLTILLYLTLLTIIIWLAYLNRKVVRLSKFIKKIRLEEHYGQRRL